MSVIKKEILHTYNGKWNNGKYDLQVLRSAKDQNWYPYKTTYTYYVRITDVLAKIAVTVSKTTFDENVYDKFGSSRQLAEHNFRRWKLLNGYSVTSATAAKKAAVAVPAVKKVALTTDARVKSSVDFEARTVKLKFKVDIDEVVDADKAKQFLEQLNDLIEGLIYDVEEAS